MSVLVEWENILLAEDDRSARMLRALAAQMAELDVAFELLVVFNPDQADPAAVEQAVRTHFRPGGRHEATPIRVQPLPGAHYFEMRNQGARAARAPVLLCLDSDVVPEAGWLNALLTPILTDPSIDVIGGTTYVEPDSLFARAIAAGWIFNPRDPDDSLRSGHLHFWANNVAFRRDFFLENPYPEHTHNGETRNADWRLRNALKARDKPVWIAGAARVSHPAPNGFRHTVNRALGEGRDQAIMWAERGMPRPLQALRAMDFALGRVRRCIRNAARRRQDLRMPLWEAPLAVLITAGYATLLVLGAWTRTLLPARFSMGWRF